MPADPIRRALICAGVLWLLAPTSEAAQAQRQPREVTAFSKIELDGPADLIFTQDARHGLVLEAEPRVLARLRATVRDGVLRFDYGPAPLVTDAPLRFHVSGPRLDALASAGSGDVRIAGLTTPALSVDASGSGDVHIGGLDTERIEIRQSGAGNLRLAGRADRLRIAAENSGDLDAGALRSRAATVRMDGSGDVAVSVRDELEAELHGAGDLHVAGAARIRQRIDGTGELLRER